MIVGITSDIKKYFTTYIDILDHNWINYFERKKINYFQFPNSIKLTNNILKRKNLKIDLIIFPGGCDINNNKPNIFRINTEKNILKFAIKKKIPLVGICHGMQLINIFFKGKLSKVKNHMKKNKQIYLKNKNVFNKKQLIVKCYHNYGIKEKFLGINLKSLGNDLLGNVEIFKHKNYKIYGFMFHPEREKNYINLDKIIQFILKK